MNTDLADRKRRSAQRTPIPTPAPPEVASKHPSPVFELAARMVVLTVFVVCGLLWLRAAAGTGNTFAWVMVAAAAVTIAVCARRVMAA